VGEPVARCPGCGVDVDEASGPHRCVGSVAATVDSPVRPARRRRRRTSAQPVDTNAPDENLGRVLGGQYLVLQRIGQGGMGSVYVVEHVTLKKRFAAKILAPEMARRPASVARFEIEAVSASKLEHDHIVNVVNFGHDDGLVYLIMELLRGEPLDERVSRGPVDPVEAVQIMLPVCRALGAAHAAGIIHRDIKPANVFLAWRNDRLTVKVLDFGVSKILEGELAEMRLTQSGQVLGSPVYMSPEAARGAPDLDARADVYSVGVVLYELISGRPPFQASNFLQLLQQHIHVEPLSLRERVPRVPEALDRVVMRALAKDRAARPQSMEDLEAELLAAMPEIDPAAPLSLSWEPLAHAQRLPPTPPAGSLMRRTVRLGRPRHIALALAALVLAGGAALWLARPPSQPAAATRDLAAPATAPLPVAVLVDASPPAEVTLSVQTQPVGATVVLDGVTVGTTPLSLPLPRSSTVRELRVELSGFRPETRALVPERDAGFILEMQKVRKAHAVPDADIKEGR
jgi:eukaryotic-like serine/threonine-protein kinase